MGPWLKTFPKKVSGYRFVQRLGSVTALSLLLTHLLTSRLQMMDRAPYYIVYPCGTFTAVYLLICWTDAEDAKEDYEHRF